MQVNLLENGVGYVNDILIVSERRHLLKMLCSNLEKNHGLSIHAVPFSANTVSEFLEIRPDLLILDSHLAVPYQSIIQKIQHIDQTQITIVLTDAQNEWVNSRNVVSLKHESLTSEHLHQAVYTILNEKQIVSEAHDYIELDWQENHIRLNRIEDHMIFTITSSEVIPINLEIMKCIEDHLRATSKSIKIYPEGKTMLCIVSSLETRIDVNIKELSQILFNKFGLDHSIIYWDDMHWSTLESLTSEINLLEDYHYFLRGSVISSYDISDLRTKASFDIINNLLVGMLSSVLEGRTSEVSKYLKELFIKLLKPSKDLCGLSYARTWLSSIASVLESISKESHYEIKTFPAIELELEYTEKTFKKYATRFEKQEISKTVYKAILFIYENFDCEISLDNAAQSLSVNKIYLSRVFKKNTGTTFMEVLIMHRLKVANHFLSHTHLKIYEISNRVGYSDSHYFGRLYKKRIGMSPNEYRVRSGDYSNGGRS